MTTTASSLFVFPATGQKVRTAQYGDKVEFVLTDVCRCLGAYCYGSAVNTAAAVRLLKSDEWRVATVIPNHPRPFEARVKSGILITESGLYRIVMRSDKPEARQFQDWVTRDVLPAIRETGVYVRGEEMLKPGAVETLDLNDLDALRDQIERLQARKIELLEANLAAAKATLTEHIHNVSLDEWRALRHLYFTTEQRTAMWRGAVSLARAQGVTLQKQERTIRDRYGKEHLTLINIYPAPLLDEVGRSIGLAFTAPA